MPLNIPTLAETRALSRDGVIEALKVDRLPGNCPAGILADDNAALAFQNFQYLQRLGIEFLPDLAGEQMLVRWADIYLGGRKAATYATLTATVSGPAGLVIPQGTQFAFSGLFLQSTAAVTLGGPTVATLFAVRALTAGIVGNLDTGTGLAFVTAVPGVTSSATVVGIASPGVDVEGVEALRDRVLARIRRPPMGGDADDYEAWAKQVPGVTRVWVAPNGMGVGTAVVYVMLDDLRAAQNGFATLDDCAAVATHLAPIRPVTVADLFVVTPQAQPINVRIRGLTPDTPSTRAGAISGIQAMLRERAAPAHAVNGSLAPAQTIYASWVSEAISAAPGVDHFDLDFADAVMPSNGAMATLAPGVGSISFG